MDRGRSLASYSPWGHKELDTTERLTHTYSPSEISPALRKGLRVCVDSRQQKALEVWGTCRVKMPGGRGESALFLKATWSLTAESGWGNIHGK